MLKSDLCDFSDDAYIVVEGDITLEDDNNANKRNKLRCCNVNVQFV